MDGQDGDQGSQGDLPQGPPRQPQQDPAAAPAPAALAQQLSATRQALDETRHALAEARRQLAFAGQDHAAQQRQQLAAIVESSYDAIIGKTLDGRITSWNAAAAALFGYSAAEAIGMPVLRLIPPEREAEERRILADLAQGRRVPPFDTVRQARDGRRIEVTVTVSPIRDALGRIVGASKIVRDITQQRQAALLLAESRRAQEASRLKSQFLANMSHELRTPLNAIIGFADLLGAGAVPAGSAKQGEFLGHIASSGRHLLQLINDVLDLSKVESGKFEFAPEPVQLPRLLHEVLGVLQSGLQRKQLQVEVDLDPALGPLVLDPARLKQALYNYLSNAIKFTPERGRITVRACAEGAALLRIEVEDNGLGIAPADLDRLFVEFQQLDSGHAKEHAGTGLGLALTRRLVWAQGGQVGVRSQLGIGSVFHLVLPRVHDPAGRPTTGEAGDRPAPGGAGHRAGQAGTEALALGLLLPGQAGFSALAGAGAAHAGPAAPMLALSLPGPAGQAASFALARVLGKPLRTGEVAAAMARITLPADRAPRVLVIDDDPAALALMQATLQALGMQVVGVDDSRRALRELDQHRPDAIVLDLMMPGLDGFEALEALRSLPAWCETPVFVWTSMILSDEDYARLAGSARAILAKGDGALAGLLDTLSRWRPKVHP